jgi:hypothetical protein
MSSLTQSTERFAADSAAAAFATARDRTHGRAVWVATALTVFSIGLFADLLLVQHTSGDEIWGPVTAALSALTGGLSLALLLSRGRNRAARYGLIAMWLTVAFFGFGGYNSHRLPLPEGTVDSRPRPPLAPLVFTGIGLAGAYVVRSGSKGS